MNKQTKILCTIGPASDKVGILEKMMRAGMNAARLNFSHGTHDSHRLLLKTIRKAAKKTNKTIAIVQDLQGPRIRLGVLPESGVKLARGHVVTFTTDPAYSEEYKDNKLFVTYKNLHKDIRQGDTILIMDGLIKVEVGDIVGHDIIAKVLIGGTVFTHKGLNFPDTSLSISPITKKDKEDLRFGVEQGVDWVALSFVSSAKDIKSLRRLIVKYHKELSLPLRDIKVIPKIEKREAIENIDSIIEEADGIMIARGDLGIELSPEEVPLLQKEIIDKCVHHAKPVVVATQMLESMMQNARPTRAEAADVANAIIDHTDVVMLSGETAGGQYPVEVVQTMADIITHVEESSYDDLPLADYVDQSIGDVRDSLCMVSALLARQKDIDLIVTASLSGHTARCMSRYRPGVPIAVATHEEGIARQLALSYGTYAFALPTQKSLADLFKNSLSYLKRKKMVKKGQKVLFFIGDPKMVENKSSILEIIEI